jgi:hypothetical protein
MELEDFGMNCKYAVKLESVKISFEEPCFYVKEEENKVFCKLGFYIKGPEDVIRIIENFADAECCEVTAYAKLHPEDNFDLNVGMKVARARAETMAYRQFERMLCRITWRLMGVIDAFVDFNEKTQNVIESNNKYISKF